MTEQKQKLLGKTKTAVMTLNKKLIIGIACVIMLVFLIIIVNALNAPTSSGAPSISTSSNNQGTQAGLASLSNLPQNYGATDQISTIMARGEGGAAVQQLLKDLQAQQADLQQQLSSLKNQSGTNTSQFSAQATNSSIFFAGGAPAQQQQTTMTPATTTPSTTTPSTTSASIGTDSYAQQNMQGQKLDFLTSQPNKDIYNNNTVQYPASPYILQAGSVIPVVLQTTISTDLPGAITALVSQDVYDSISGKYLLIPRGSRLIGEYNSNVAYGQSQVQAKFTRLIRPDGTSVVLPNQPGVNGVGTSGMSDEIDNHWSKIIGAASLAAIFDIPGIIATNQMNNNSGYYNGSNWVPQQNLGSVAGASALQGVGQSASSVGSAIANKSLNIQPTLIINAGYQFSIMVTKDIVLPPYSTTNPAS